VPKFGRTVSVNIHESADGKLLVMTPVDPLFLLIPILGAIKKVK
jgi:hypothetical protein